jgi:hypothetical protein
MGISRSILNTMKIGAMKVFEAAELCDTLLQIRTTIARTIQHERRDIDAFDPNSPYPMVRRLHNLSGQKLSLAQALKLKEAWRHIANRGEFNLTLSDCEIFLNSHKSILDK